MPFLDAAAVDALSADENMIEGKHISYFHC
jgi:hypothetical protein